MCPFLLESGLPRSLWPDILLTKAGSKVFLSKHKLELLKCSGARWLRAMLISGNKMAVPFAPVAIDAN